MCKIWKYYNEKFKNLEKSWKTFDNLNYQKFLGHYGYKNSGVLNVLKGRLKRYYGNDKLSKYRLYAIWEIVIEFSDKLSIFFHINSNNKYKLNLRFNDNHRYVLHFLLNSIHLFNMAIKKFNSIINKFINIPDNITKCIDNLLMFSSIRKILEHPDNIEQLNEKRFKNFLNKIIFINQEKDNIWHEEKLFVTDKNIYNLNSINLMQNGFDSKIIFNNNNYEMKFNYYNLIECFFNNFYVLINYYIDFFPYIKKKFYKSHLQGKSQKKKYKIYLIKNNIKIKQNHFWPNRIHNKYKINFIYHKNWKTPRQEIYFYKWVNSKWVREPILKPWLKKILKKYLKRDNSYEYHNIIQTDWYYFNDLLILDILYNYHLIPFDDLNIELARSSWIQGWRNGINDCNKMLFEEILLNSKNYLP